MQTPILPFSFAIGSFAVLVACSHPSEPDQVDGARFFSDNCVACHGTSGTGNGPAASGLPKPPTDLILLSRNNGGTFPTARALSYIYGDPVNGHLARVMPDFGAVMGDDLVPLDIDGTLTPTPPALVGLLAYMETLQK